MNRLVRLTGAYSISRNCLISSMLAVNERSQRLEGGGRDVLDVDYRSYTLGWAVFELDGPEVGAGEGSEMAVIGGLQTVVCGP